MLGVERRVDMTKVQLLSRETDWKVLIVVVSLLFSAFVGYLLPTPTVQPTLSVSEYPPLTVYCGIRFLDALLTTALLVLVWAVFRLLEPGRRYSRTWVIAKTVGIPVIWLLLVIALGFWFSHLHEELLRDIYGHLFVT
jgi:hypothetical protein